MTSIAKILHRYKQYNDLPEHLYKIQAAYDVAVSAHAGQRRQSNDPYIVHPLSVAYILADLELDWEVICAALLHDTIEDANITAEELENKFGQGVASMVESLTKIQSAVSDQNDSILKAKADTYRKIVIGMTNDLRVIFIKLADRWDNMRTLHHLDLKRRKRIAKETMKHYVPIAERLGIALIKRDLENLCFLHLKPKQYHKYSRRLTISKGFLKNDIRSLKKYALKKFQEIGIACSIYEKFKTPHSIHSRSRQKLRPYFVNINVITQSPRDCYLALGIIHEIFKPVPGTPIKDFISVPRTNAYQSLHTAILYRENVYPIHIRTDKMDKIATHGVLRKFDGAPDEKYKYWIELLKELIEEEVDSTKFMRRVETATEEDQIYVCTPKGDYWGFPLNSTVLDFAYRIHTEIGHHCMGAMIDNQPAHIFDELLDGSVVEIITSADVSPQSEWLSQVKTTRSQNAIRNWLESKRKIRSKEFGRKMLAHEMEKFNLDLTKIIETPEFLDIIKKTGAIDLQDLFSKIGRGVVSTRKVISEFVDPREFKKVLNGQSSLFPRIFQFLFSKNDRKDVYQIKDIHDVFIKLSKCCHPLPGDDVVGILSMRHGISVHKSECNMLKSRDKDDDRLLKLSWDINTQEKHAVRMLIRFDQRPDVPSNILNTLHERNIPLISMSLKRTVKSSKIDLELEMNSADQAELILNLFKKMKGIQKAQRF